MELEEATEILKDRAEFCRDNILLEEETDAIETVLAELEHKDKVINEMAKEIFEMSGTCPNDIYNYKCIVEETGDVDLCKDEYEKCFRKYFENKVKGE